MTTYATVDDYELRTGVDVPTEMEPTVQARLDDTSALIELYLGDCVDAVVAEYADVLTALTVSHTYQMSARPPGVRSESIGGTSVSYSEESAGAGLSAAMTDVLDDLIARVCPADTGVPGLGTVGATWGGRAKPSDTAWMRDVDVWVM